MKGCPRHFRNFTMSLIAHFLSRYSCRIACLLSFLGISASGTQSPGVSPSIPRYDRFREISPTCIKPEGWLKEYLVRQQKGLTSHPKEHGFPFNTQLWEGEINNKSNSWWPYEQTAYYLDGMMRLGLLLNDQAKIDTFKRNIQWVVTHPNSRGLIGTSLRKNESLWPNGVFFKAVIPYYMATGDKQIVDAFHKHFSLTTAKDIGLGFRNATNIEGLLKTYEWTGDTALKDKAVDAYKIFNTQPATEERLTMAATARNNKIVMHGVTFSEELKLPAILYIYTGDPSYLQAAENAIRVLERDHMGPSGVPSSTEYLSTRDPSQPHETCVSSDFTWTLGYFLMATGNAKYADMIEKACFNAGPGAVSKDFTNLQYMSGDNQFIATDNSTHSKFHRGTRWMSYSPHHEPACCPGNVHRLMPNFASRMWMTDSDGILTAVLYGPSTISGPLGQSGRTVTVHEKTDYPFSDTVEFKFETDEQTTVPFRFRIPAWCASPEIAVNGQTVTGDFRSGSFAQLNRTFKNGDVVTLRFPMPLHLNRYQNSLSLERGPLLYSYAIPEQVDINSRETGNPQFPTLSLKAAAPWNYALALDESNFRERVRVLPKKNDAYPFDGGDGAPALQVPVQRIPGWKLEENRFTPLIPIAYTTDGKEETITLTPYGATRLRLTHFPECVNRTLLPVSDWQLSPAYPYDIRKPIQDQIYSPETGETTSWKDIAPEPSGLVNMDRLLGGNGKLAYARASIKSDSEGPAYLAVNTKDACEIWFNGRKIHTIQQPNDVEYQGADLIPVTLKKGNNTVLLKAGRFGRVGQYPDGWGIKLQCVR